MTKIQEDRKTKRQKYKKEFKIVMSGQYRTLAMFKSNFENFDQPRRKTLVISTSAN